MDEKNVHHGHRQRLKNRFINEGLAGFNEINVVELLLFYCVPRQDTNVLAHRLLDAFGSLDKLMEASAEELERVEGIGSHISTFFQLLPQVSRYYHRLRASRTEVMETIDDCGEYMLPLFMDQKNEMVYLLCMDAKRKVLSCDFIGEGSVNSASVPIRRIVEMALKAGASVVVLGHNHPSGLALPSGEDVETTKHLAKGLRAVDIILFDHLVFADDEYVSMVQSGYYDPSRDTLF